jgi:pilus assembly protein CpaC
MSRRFLLVPFVILATGTVLMPVFAAAQASVTVQRGENTNAIDVPINRGVVVEVSEPFVELSVANPNIADIATLSDRSAYVLGKAAGRTSLTIIGEEGRLISNVEVRVSPDIAEFKERLSEILPRESIEVRTANDGIVLSGRVSGAQTLSRALELAEMYAPDKVTNMMSVSGTQQVMLKVRFAEMQRAVAKGLGSQLGINVTGSDGSGSFTSNPTIPGGVAAVGGLGISFAAGDLAINLLLEALEEKGLVRTLAEPNLVAISGEEAQFLAGGEYPVPVAQEEDTVTIEYKPFGVELGFTPTVVEGGLINLHIRSTVSAIDTNNRVVARGLAVDAFRVRRADTTVEMRDGQSFAIAGLLQDEFDGDINQLPWIGDVPVLGALFRSSSYRRRQSELVIIVTPHLVAPVAGTSLSQPTDRVALPSESQFFLRGQLTSGRAGEAAGQGFQGAHGYVFD